MTGFFDTPRSRRDVFKLSAAVGAAAGLVGALGACAPGGTAAPQSGTSAAGAPNADGTITAAISYELGTNGYDPMTTSAALTIAVNWHTLEGLTEIDPASRETYPALAAALPEATGSSVEVKLRDGATFHDGSKVTAEDVAYSFARVLDPANNSLYATFIPFIDRVTAVDESTVKIALKYPTKLLADRLAVVKIVPKAAVEAGAEAFDANPVGSGPWKMTDNGASSKKIVFERFDAYNGSRKAKAKAMQWQIIPDASTRTNAIQSKSVQAIDSVPYLSIDQLKAQAQVESVQGFGLLFAMFNNDPSNPFNKLANRQGFLYAIDMDKVIQTGLLGQAEPATAFLQKEHPDYVEASTVYALDAAKAKELFASTGLTSFRMLCTDHDWVQKVTPIIQESLKAVGVDVSFEQKQSADVYNTIDGKPDAFDVVIAPGDPSVFGNDPDLLMSWWYAGDTWTDTRMHWKGQTSYTKVQKLLDQSARATDEATQKSAWGELFNVLADEVPLYPLFHRKAPTAWNGATLVDFTPISLTGLSFLEVATTK